MLSSATLNRPNCTAWEWFCKAGDEFRFDLARRENSVARSVCHPPVAKKAATDGPPTSWLCHRNRRPPALLTFSSPQYKLLPSPERRHITDRIRFIRHESKRLLVL